MFRFNFKNENKGVNSLTCLDLISKIENKGVNSSFWSCLKQFFFVTVQMEGRDMPVT